MKKIEAKMAVSNLKDLSIFTVVGALQIALLFVLPSYIVYVATENTAIAYGVGIALYLVFLSFCALSISLSENGIKLNRILGTPKQIPWSAIHGFKEVEAKEVIIFGWLWPPFPPRESTPCMSCYGHFRISYNGGYFYYPPADREDFIQSMEQYGARKL